MKKNKLEPDVLPAIKNSRNAHLYPKTGERSTKPSLTQPDQTMTVREILDRYAKGRPISGAKVPVYHTEEDEIMGLTPTEIAKMDLSERQVLADQVADALVDLKLKLQAEAKTKKERDYLEKIDKEVKSRLKEIADKKRNEITDLKEEENNDNS